MCSNCEYHRRRGSGYCPSCGGKLDRGDSLTSGLVGAAVGAATDSALLGGVAGALVGGSLLDGVLGGLAGDLLDGSIDD